MASDSPSDVTWSPGCARIVLDGHNGERPRQGLLLHEPFDDDALVIQQVPRRTRIQDHGRRPLDKDHGDPVRQAAMDPDLPDPGVRARAPGGGLKVYAKNVLARKRAHDVLEISLGQLPHPFHIHTRNHQCVRMQDPLVDLPAQKAGRPRT